METQNWIHRFLVTEIVLYAWFFSSFGSAERNPLPKTLDFHLATWAFRGGGLA